MEYKVTYAKQNYNLNALLSFDLLKEVLYKLLISQENLEKEIEKIKASNAKRDKEISKLKDNVGEMDENFFDENEEESNNASEEENEHEENKDKIEDENKSQKENELEEKKSQKDKKEDSNIIINKVEKDQNISEQDKNLYKPEQFQFDKSNQEVNYEAINSNINSKDNIKNKDNDKDNKNENIINKNDEDIDKKEEIKKTDERNNEEHNSEINIENNNEINTEKNKDKNIKNEVENKSDKNEGNNLDEINIDNKEVKKPKKKKQFSEQREMIEYKRENNVQQASNQIPPDLIRNMAKQIKDNKKKIVELEKRLKNEIKSTSDSLKKDYQKIIKDHNMENRNDLEKINSKFEELFNSKEDLEKKMEDCISKCSTIDIYNMFKDSGDGTVDAAKVMVRALEEKVFKKFELVDTRYKKDAADNLKAKNNLENLLPKSEKLEKNIEKFNEILDKKNEEIDNFKKEIEDQNEKMKLLIDDNNNNLVKNLERIKNDFDNVFKNKLNDLEKQVNVLKNSLGDGTTELFKLGFGNKGANDEVIQSIEKKISDLRRKINDIENTLKLQSENKDIGEIKSELNNLKLISEKKIAKEDLKELYNLHLSDVDELNDLKDNASISFGEIRRIKDEITNIFQKLDNINGNIVLLQNSRATGGPAPIINFDKYVDNQKFTDTLKPILKEIEKIYREIDSLHRNLSEYDDYFKELAKVERLNRLENEMNNKLIELKSVLQKKLVDKAEFAKNIKQLEIEIKALDMENKKSDADSWIMGKKPIGCFNCATCEANIKNENPSNEYLVWNKYPQQDKIYRMGQGFSHMLQMMTSEFIKSIGNAQKENDNDSSSKNNIRYSTNLVLEKNQLNINNDNYNSERKNSASVLRVNNKEQINDEILKKISNYNLYSSKAKGKIQLPRVFKFQKKLKLKNEDNNIPVSDDEYSGMNNSLNKEGFKTVSLTSPSTFIFKASLDNSKSASLSKQTFASFTFNQFQVFMGIGLILYSASIFPPNQCCPSFQF